MSDAELYDQEIYDLVMSLTVTEIPDEPPVLSAEKLNIQAALGLMAAGTDLAEQVRRGVPGIVHDHMHWEDGKLVEDTCY